MTSQYCLYVGAKFYLKLRDREPRCTSRAIVGVQGARARACAARQPRLQLKLAPMTSFVTSFPRRYRDVI